MIVIILISSLMSLLISMLLTKKFIVYLRNIGLVGYDIHKPDKREVPEMGGPAVIFGFLAGVYIYVGAKVFTMHNYFVSHILAAALTITTIMMIAMMDDLTGLMKRRGIKRIGLKQKHKFLLPLPAAIPLMVVNAGTSTISLPFVGIIDAGVLYSLVLVPIGIFGAANATNMLAGLNGLESGMGFVALLSLGVFSLMNNQMDAAVLAFSFAGALLGFLYFNRYPARIMPGDSLTYAIGATIASVAIVGNIERFALVIFIPWFLEFLLKARTRFKGESFGKLRKDGSLAPINNRIESLTHIPMVLFRADEKRVVSFLVAMEILICLIAFLIYA